LANYTSPAKVVPGTTATAQLRATKNPRRWCSYLAAFLAAALLSTETGFLAGQCQDVVKNWLKTHSVAARATEHPATALVSTPQPRKTDSDLEAISHMAPQQQAERLLELAIERPDLSLSLIRRNLASWCGHLADSDRLFRLVLEALNSDDPRVRVAAVEIDLTANNLAPSRASVEKLMREIEGGTEERFMALWRLGSLGNRGVEPAEAFRTLKLYACSRNQAVRFWAVEGLAMLGNDAAMEALLDILAHDPALEIRQRAANGLSKSGLLTGEQRLRAVPELLNLLDDDSLDEATESLVGATLEAITRASFGKNAGAWRDWWAHHDSPEKHATLLPGHSLA
jgi:HEAT repeat protein